MPLLRKILLLSTLATAVVGLSPTAAMAAKGGTSTPLRGSLSGSSTVHFVLETPQFPGLCTTTNPCALGSGTDTGKLSGLGQVSATGTVAVRFNPDGSFRTVSQITVTAKGGTLAVLAEGTGHVTSVGPFVVGSTTESTVTEHILAGTGKFVGATGTATAEQKGVLTSIHLGTDCLGAVMTPCLQFTSFDSITLSGTLNR